MSADTNTWTAYYLYLTNLLDQKKISQQSYLQKLANARQAELDGKHPHDFLLQGISRKLQSDEIYHAYLQEKLKDKLNNNNYYTLTGPHNYYPNQSAKSIMREFTRPRKQKFIRLRKFVGLPYKP